MKRLYIYCPMLFWKFCLFSETTRTQKAERWMNLAFVVCKAHPQGSVPSAFSYMILAK